jgi:hypothetical protein
MTSSHVNNALADIMMSHRKNYMNDNEVANCTNMLANCYKLLDSVKKEEDLDRKKVMLTELFNKIRACADCKSFSYLMSNRISHLMTEFNNAVYEHNARLDEENGQSTAGSRRRNKKSKNSKKKSRKSRKSRKTKSRRH